ncbi:hypothetical protein KJ840_01350 [Patescibacteria group bacterium]|nr:hypothetical protein [Patescibacteria group bacterium]
MPDIKPPVIGDQIKKSEAEQAKAASLARQEKKGGAFKVIIIIIIITVIVLIGLFLVSKYTSLNILNINKPNAAENLDKPSGWSAVFLSNGQVYFGKIKKQDDYELVLTDIYYLQVTKQIQPADQTTPPQQQNVSLVKLGNELHGPRDAMSINMYHIIFTEELKLDSKVVQAIDRYLEENP